MTKKKLAMYGIGGLAISAYLYWVTKVASKDAEERVVQSIEEANRKYEEDQLKRLDQLKAEYEKAKAEDHSIEDTRAWLKRVNNFCDKYC